MIKRIYFVLAALLLTIAATAQSVTGRVIGDSKEPLIGVQVIVKGSNKGTVSDVSGDFTLSGIENKSVLVFSYIGYETKEITTVGNKPMTVTMKPSDKNLDEVLVIGYGSAKRKDLTSSISSVDAGTINKQTVQNPTQALQGKVAGVQITNSGAPGSSPQVRIRGMGTITDGAGPLYIVDNVIVNDISYLGPNDIDNITILKDASSAAIYGVRAAGGVILITTKKGSNSKPTISFDSYVGIKSPAHVVQMATGPEYVQLYNEKMAEIGDPSRLDPAQYSSHNYYDDILTNSITNSENLSISGGSSSSKYSVGISHLTDNGLVVHDNYDRTSFRAKLDMNLGKYIRMGFSNVLTYTKSKPQSTYYVFKAHQVVPIFQPKTANGDWTNPLSVSRDLNVAAAEYYNQYAYQNAYNLILNGYVEVDLFKDFTFRTSLSLNPNEVDYTHYYPSYNISSYQNSPKNALDKNRTQSLNTYWDNTLTYTKTIADNHHLKVMLGTSYQEETWNTLNAHVEGLKDLPAINESYLFLTMPKIDNLWGSSNSDNGDKTVAHSYLGRLTYDYKEKYLLTATFRNDISSKFPVQNRSAFFPSIGAGWVLTSEDFMKSTKIDYLKLRANWGRMGNGVIPSNIYVPTITTDNYRALIFGSAQNSGSGQVSSIGTVTQFYNSNLRWETVSEFDAGVDIHLLKDRLTATIDYYNRNTIDAIFPITSLPSSGLSTSGVWGNNATINNSGLELTLNWSDKVNDFTYNLGANVTYNQNKVTSLAASSAGGIYGSFYDFPPTFTYSTVGQPIGEFYGLKTIGVYQNAAEINNSPHMSGAIPGDLKFQDSNGDGTIDAKDRVFLGNPNPPVYFGFDASLQYKSWDATVAFQGVTGNKIANAVSMWRYGTENFEESIVKNRWHGEGTSTYYPSAALSNAQTFSSFYVEDGSYLRVKNIQIGYSLPKNFLNKFGVNKLRFYINGENIHTFTKYTGFSPEVPAGGIMAGVDKEAYPLASVYSVGLNLNF